MANTFKNSITGSIGTDGVTVYTAPVSSQVTTIGFNISNVETQNIYVDVQLHDNSEATSVYLTKNTLIPEGGSVSLIGGEQKVVLEAEDYFSVTSSVATSADVIVSVLEIT
jgi:hypothetical protein